MNTHLRQLAREIFASTLKECTIESAFARDVEYSRGVLRVRDDLYDLDRYSRVLTIAIGKAAHSMAAALRGRIGDRASGIIAVPHEAGPQLAGFRYYLGGHPLPNAESMKAGSAILQALRGSNHESFVIFLISGGASAAVESPYDPELTLDDIIGTYSVLVHSGANIAEINAIRKHLSAIKGGRMAQAAAPAQQLSILVSDVPEGALDALASGPTMPDSSSCERCYEIAARYAMAERFPAAVRDLFVERALEETPKADDPAFVRSRWWTLLSSAHAEQIAAARAAAAGFAVEIDHSCDDWAFADAADHLLARLRELRRGVSRACIISGGEVTVRVPHGCAAGIGGRNQHFALYCAEKISGEDIAVLSAGTDGIDGNSEAAGAVVDGSTLVRIGVERARDALRRFDAYPALQNAGDTIMTGPTGNNLRDLRILLAE